MRVQAWAGTGRAIVAIDPEPVVNRNLMFDPRFSRDLHDLSTAGPDGRPLMVDARGNAWPYVQGGWAQAWPWQPGPTGAGMRFRVLPHPTAPPGATLHGVVRVGAFPEWPASNWQARFTRQDGTVLGPAALHNGPGTVEFTGAVGPGGDTYVEVLSLNAEPFYVDLAYAGTRVRSDVFSGSDPGTPTAVYSWEGTNGRAVSAETLTAEHETISVHRVVGSDLVPVRGYQHVPAVGASISDNDVPLRVGVFYQVTTGSGQRYFSNVVLVQPNPPAFGDPGSWPILSNPVTGESVRVILVSWDTKTHKTDKTRVRVLGRRSPVVISDVEAAPDSTIVVETATKADRDALASLVADGAPLLLRAPCPDIEDAYLDIETRQVSRVIKQGHSERREHSLTAVEIDAPAMDQRGRGDTLGDLAAATFTLEDIAARWATLGDVAAADLIAGGVR